jgi:hypothetical protein
MIFDEEAEFTTFTSEQKKEYLYQLFKVIVVGGAMCQAEENLEAWQDMTLKLYKDTISVQKKSGGGVEVATKVYKISAPKGGLFPVEHSKHNMCFVTIAKSTGVVNLVYKKFKPFW